MISVIVPLYNKGNKVCRTIDSILKQDFIDFEVVVVDDGSIDDSQDYVLKYKDSRIHYFYKENGGVSSARNYGVKVSNGEWLLFLDADDELADNALSEILKLRKTYPHCRCVVGNTLWLQDGRKVNQKLNCKKAFISKTPFFLIWCNKIYPATRNMAIHRSLVEEYGGFDERMSFYEDWEFSLRMMRHGEFAYTNKYIGIYNQDGTGLSGSKHLLEKEMSYYIPELMQKAGFWEKCLLYSNIEEIKNYWTGDNHVLEFYNSMQQDYFTVIYSFMHTLRQKLSSKGFI